MRLNRLKRGLNFATPSGACPAPNGSTTTGQNPAQATTSQQTAGTVNASSQAQTAQSSNSTAFNQSALQQKVYDRDIINLIYYLIKDNPEGCERFNRLLVDKVESFLSPLVAAASTPQSIDLSPVLCSVTQANMSPVRAEMILLGALMQKQFDDSCWEQRLRVVIHILLRSLSVANLIDQQQQPASTSSMKQQRQQQHYNNPIVIECLTLPCLRILNHLCKSSTNVAHITHLITSSRTQKSSTALPTSSGSPAVAARHTSTSLAVNNSLAGPLGRYYSEPSDANHFQVLNSLLFRILLFGFKKNACMYL